MAEDGLLCNSHNWRCSRFLRRKRFCPYCFSFRVNFGCSFASGCSGTPQSAQFSLKALHLVPPPIFVSSELLLHTALSCLRFFFPLLPFQCKRFGKLGGGDGITSLSAWAMKLPFAFG
jgi:hypothetical protein